MFHPMFFLFGLALYFLPSILGRNKRNFGAIFVLNLLLGWTLIGWVVALVWAVSSDAQAPQYYAPQPYAAPPQPSMPPGCPSCRSPIQPGQHFCPSCGARLA
jgi:Superinfection immunity protein/zinc-ribbon domain